MKCRTVSSGRYRGRGESVAVGDVKQSIYRFRLAEPGIFLEKYRTYADADQRAPGAPRRRVLSRNFRSRREVLAAANFVFAALMSREMGELDYTEEQYLHFGAEYYPEGRGIRSSTIWLWRTPGGAVRPGGGRGAVCGKAYSPYAGRRVHRPG